MQASVVFPCSRNMVFTLIEMHDAIIKALTFITGTFLVTGNATSTTQVTFISCKH